MSDKITHFRHDEAASLSAPASEGEKTPVPTDLLPWLGQTAYLLNLYLNGLCPKDVARGLIEKIKYNWPHMLITVPEQAAGEGATLITDDEWLAAHDYPELWKNNPNLNLGRAICQRLIDNRAKVAQPSASQQETQKVRAVLLMYPRAECVCLPSDGRDLYGIIDKARIQNAELSELRESEAQAWDSAYSKLSPGQQENRE